MKHDTKIILDIDSAHLDKQIKHIKKYLHDKSGLFLPKEYLEYCQGCGERFYKKPEKKFYFGDWFCGECVEKWSQGHK